MESENRAVVIVSGVAAISPFTTPDQACKTGYAAGNTDTYLRDYLLEMGYRVYTSPAMIGPGEVLDQEGEGGPFGDCPPALPETMTVDAISPVDLGGPHLARFVNHLYAEYGVDSVDFVAHSLGGLTARVAIRELKANKSPVKVRSLTTVGSPWAGAMIANPLTEQEPLSACDGLAVCEKLLQDLLGLPGIDGLVTTQHFDNMRVWNANQAGVLDGIPVTLIAGDYFTKAGGDPNYWPNDGLIQLKSAHAIDLSDAVLPHRECFTFPNVHSIYITKAIGEPDELALTWNPEVGATIDAAIRNADTALDQPNRAGCPVDAVSLKISAFKDISAFILDLIQNEQGVPLDVKYVKNADEAHADLKQGQADIVFMSYDDTLSLALQDHYADIAAFLPIHGGILDLCGTLDVTGAATRVGIDTDTGYARALRLLLQDRLGPERYAQLDWIKAGATNLRYQQLLDGQLDATLLNPPFSYRPGINFITALSGNAVIPRYQGVVANTNRSWVERDPGHAAALATFVAAYRDTITAMQSQSEATIAKLASFYQLSSDEATAIYARLWAADGLNQTTAFDPAALAGTEQVFAGDTGIAIPASRTWLLEPLPGIP